MEFDTVFLCYPNEWPKNSTYLQKSKKEKCSDSFGWFLCSERVFDDKLNLYYSSISPHVQFYNPLTGKTMTARGLSKKGEGLKTEIVRARLLILSDPHNKKIMCQKYNYECGCNSKRDVLSTECSLTSKESLKKGGKWAVKKGYDGVMIRHDSHNSKKCKANDLICPNVTFVFRKGILTEVDKPSRCSIIKYSKRNNTTIRKIRSDFPTCKEIDNMLTKTNCNDVSQQLYSLLLR